jgi:hypothetical protein
LQEILDFRIIFEEVSQKDPSYFKNYYNLVLEILSQIQEFFKNLQLKIFENLKAKNFDELK